MQQLLTQFQASYLKKNIPEIRPGDSIRVHFLVREGDKERVQNFEGLVIARKHGKGLDATFTVRKISFGIGVERTFPLHSPLIVKIEKLKTAKVHRAKLYYLRKPRAKRLRGEVAKYAVWEEKEAQVELEKIEEEKAKEVELKEQKKKEEEQKLEEEFQKRQQEKAGQSEQTKEDSGAKRGESSRVVSQKQGTKDTGQKS